MKVLVTGVGGFVGGAFAAAAPQDVEVVGTWRSTPPADGVDARRVELSDVPATAALLDEVRPDVVVHTAYGRADLGRDVVAATASVVDAAAAVGAALVHLSSDVVFDGESAPYDEAAPPRPISAYGRAKAAAEAEVDAVLPDAAVVRTSLVLTPETLDEATRWVAEAVLAGRAVDGYLDEVRMPVHRDDLVAGLWDLLAVPRPRRAGVWHLPGPTPVTRDELARLVCAAVGADPDLVRAVPSPRDGDDPRPRDLRLACGRARAAIGWAPTDVRARYRTGEVVVPSHRQPNDPLDEP